MMPANDRAFTEHFITTDDGLNLYLRNYDPVVQNTALPVVCLPGLSRNSRDFHRLADLIASDRIKPRRVISIDFRGRGRSDRDPDAANYNLHREARDVMGILSTLEIPRAIFIGTSRGGLVAHVLAMLAQELLAAIVLNDIGPVLETEGLRLIRDYLSVSPQPKDWRQAARALKATHGHGFPIFDDEDWMDMAAAIFAERNGVIAPDYDPALVAPMKRMDLSKPAPDLWPQFECFGNIPAMVVRGEYSTLLSEGTVIEMARHHAGLMTITAIGQAHAPILHKHGVDRPIMDFIARLA